MIKLPSLHCNSEYSFQESTITIDNLIKLAKKESLKELVITDHNNMFGVFEFYKKCLANSIKPIIGVDLDVDDYRLILLAKNYDGFCELTKLSSRKMKGETIKWDDIRPGNIIIIDHPTHGYRFKNKAFPKFEEFFLPTTEDIPNAVFVNETRILKKEDNEAIGIMSAQKYNSDLFLSNLLPYQCQYNENLVQVKQIKNILNSCNLVMPNLNLSLPTFNPDSEKTSSQLLYEITKSNFAKIFDKTVDKKYIERLKSEFTVIDKLGFSDYFLIIHDIVQWTKSKNIAVGPGRGSAAGSLIAFVLGITEIDPLKFDLLFERFLNIERKSLPDIDIDIQDSRRHEVIEYVFNRWNKNCVAQISTFSRLGPKSALRDVGRVMNVPNRDMNLLTSLISQHEEDSDTLDNAYKNSTRFRAMVDSRHEYTLLFRRAKLLEGLARQHGTHAAGIVISKNVLENQFPTLLSTTNNLNQLQMTIDYLEENGLLKIDLLALRNLTILKDIEKQIFLQHNKKLDIKRIPLDDAKTNQLLSSADVSGLFQLESSRGMKSTLSEVGVDNFNDLVAIISLFRPGPMEQIKVYAKRKKGEEMVPKVSEEFDEITKNTYGIIIYQEQIMQLAQKMASMSFADADIFRRAISKKESSDFSSMREKFLHGAEQNKIDRKLAQDIFELIQKFANYGFNKSHAVAYGTLTYRLAYLKAHFPLEFYTSLINSNIGSQDALKRYILEAKQKGIKVIAPKINFPTKDVIINNKQIILPFSIIKGLGNVVENKIITECAKGKFADFYDIVLRLYSGDVSEGQIRTLINANVFRDFGNMQSLIDSLPIAMRFAKLNTVIVNDEIKIIDSILPKPKMVASKRNIDDEINNENALFGFSLNAFHTEKFENKKLLSDFKKDESEEVVLWFTKKKIFIDKNKQEFASVTLSDSSMQVSATAFASVWKFIDQTPENSLVKVLLQAEIFNNRLTYKIIKPWKVIEDEN